MQLQPFGDPPAFEDAFLFSAQRFFIASDRRFLPAALMPPRRFLGAAPPATVAAVREVAADFDLRAAHRAFIAWDNRLLPAGVIPLGSGATRCSKKAGTPENQNLEKPLFLLKTQALAIVEPWKNLGGLSVGRLIIPSARVKSHDC